MKKTFLLISALSILCLASCDKQGDPEPQPEPEPVKEYSVDFLMAVAPDQDNFIDQKFVISVGDKEVTVDAKDMVKADTAAFPIFRVKVQEKIDDLGGLPEAEYYSISLGKATQGQTVCGVRREFSPVTNRPAVEVFNFYSAYYLLLDGKEKEPDKYSIEISREIYNTDEAVQKRCELFNRSFNLSYYIR